MAYNMSNATVEQTMYAILEDANDATDFVSVTSNVTR